MGLPGFNNSAHWAEKLDVSGESYNIETTVKYPYWFFSFCPAKIEPISGLNHLLSNHYKKGLA